MGTMSCVKCETEWYEIGPSNNTICDACAQPEEVVEVATQDFKSLVCELFSDDELELLKDVDWNELEFMATEYVALQLRWKLLNIKKGSEE